MNLVAGDELNDAIGVADGDAAAYGIAVTPPVNDIFAFFVEPAFADTDKKVIEIAMRKIDPAQHGHRTAAHDRFGTLHQFIVDADRGERKADL